MTNNTLKESVNGKIQLKIGEWKYITSEYFYTLSQKENLIWHVVDSNIAQVNPNSGLLCAKRIGTTTVFAMDTEESMVKVFCSVEVQSNETSVTTKALVAKDPSIEIACFGGNNTENVYALGYSGTVFAYTVVGSRVTLEKGFGAKNGTINNISYLFRAKLIEMNNIYACMSPEQRNAWLVLRINDFIGLIGLFDPQSITETAKNIAKEILSGYGIDLGTILEATILGVYDWYLAEEEAVSYYEEFQNKLIF